MPELPEVETVCRGLADALTGVRLDRLVARRADLRQPLPPDLSARMQGRRVLSVRRRAKYILMAMEGGVTLILHLGMSGRMIVTHGAEAAGKHDHLLFFFGNGAHVRFHDPRRFGVCALAEEGDLPHHPLLARLGIEPLDPSLTPARLAALFAGKKASIKDALMDQRLVVGIGNIYASEALFYAGIDPRRAAGSCSKADIGRLVPAIRKVLQAAIKAGGSSLRDYRKADGELGTFQHRFAVYDRVGQACPDCTCAVGKTGGIQRMVQGGRSTYFCPQKQV